MELFFATDRLVGLHSFYTASSRKAVYMVGWCVKVIQVIKLSTGPFSLIRHNPFSENVAD